MNDNIIASDGIYIDTCSTIFQKYDGYNCSVKFLFDGPIGHPYLNVQALNQSSIWGDCLVQLLYIGDNALSVQGFTGF